MAGDRKLTFDWSLATTMPTPKIRKLSEGLLVGAAGSGNLCTVITTLIDAPKVETDNADIYMHFDFKKALIKSLFVAGYVDEHRLLKIPQEDHCSAIVVVLNRAFMVDIGCPDESSTHGNILGGLVEIEETSVPYAVGCGASSAFPVLLAEMKRRGYSTKEDLKLAMSIAADISPGVDRFIDIIQED